jgi:hypothetical protein
MSKTPLIALRSRSIKKWFTSEIKTMGNEIDTAYRGRSEVREGFLVADNSTNSATAFTVSFTTGAVLLGGRLIDLTGANIDLAGVAGASAGSISLAGAAVTNVSTAHLIANTMDVIAAAVAIDTDNSGAANGTAQIALIFGAGAATAAAVAPTNTQVAAAIAASAANMVGNGGWVHLAQLTFSRDGSAAYTLSAAVENRNNRLYI